MFGDLKFISQERSELQATADNMLAFLFYLVYNLYFPPFFSVWPLAFTSKKLSFGGNLWSHFDPWKREQKELPPLHFHTSCTLRIIFSMFFSFFSSKLEVHCCVLHSLPQHQLLKNFCNVLKWYLFPSLKYIDLVGKQQVAMGLMLSPKCQSQLPCIHDIQTLFKH